jgi:hypothetical protein
MKRFAPLFIFAGLILTSGAFSANAHAFSRKAADTDPAQSLAANQVWIQRADGAQSCSTKSGQSLEDGATDLKNAKVRVLDSHKGGDGKLHAQMCGAPTGSMNAYLIPKDDLPQAVALGYIQAK